ncbi:hypothetical protein GGX14DRAFT_395924 [Mycena pura]|uniref:Uncharacterized protein n=1 Tax=Mycena pura TaxID=153505 RepID=A0AAD6YAB9_9AGAR|nr:hypothetical protein GGX14DRAFT_395924 [Mycena pura]
MNRKTSPYGNFQEAIIFVAIWRPVEDVKYSDSQKNQGISLSRDVVSLNGNMKQMAGDPSNLFTGEICFSRREIEFFTSAQCHIKSAFTSNGAYYNSQLVLSHHKRRIQYESKSSTYADTDFDIFNNRVEGEISHHCVLYIELGGVSYCEAGPRKV